MNIPKALRLSLSNFMLLIVALLAQLITLAIIICLFTLILQASIAPIIEELQLYEFAIIFENLGAELANPDFSAVALGTILDQLIESIGLVAANINNINLKLTITIVLFLISLVVAKFFVGVNDIPTIAGFSQYMNNNARSPYMITYAKTFTKSLFYQLQYMLLTLLIDVILVFGLLFMLAILLIPFGIVGIIIMFIFAVIIASVRLTVFAWWMPCMVSEKHSIATALRKSLKAICDEFFSVFIQTAVIVAIGAIISITVLLLVSPLAGLITSVAIIILFGFVLKAVYMVSYYEYLNKPYYVSKLDVGIKKVY